MGANNADFRSHEFSIEHIQNPADSEGYTTGTFRQYHRPTGATSEVNYETADGENLFITSMHSERQKEGHMTNLLNHVYPMFLGHVQFGAVTTGGAKTASKMDSLHGRTDWENEVD